ncbi:hypothetical protein lerEdw1_019217 [Lerista edwardsae]|nr:hypothetical protein lerEdw1_019217 [Lerista edwardsae]
MDVSGSCDNFQERGFTNRVNSICVQSGAWVCFGHPDFRGQQYILERGEYPDFYRWNGHNDRMGSCKPVGMAFSGASELCLRKQNIWIIGRVSAILPSSTLSSSTILALSPFSHGDHYRIEVFEGRHFSGRSQEFTEDCSSLQRQGWAKKWVNAVRVYGDGAWVLYEEPNYRGQMYIVERGDYSGCDEWQAHSPGVQSIRRVINYF